MSENSQNRPIINAELVEAMSQRLIDERSLMNLADFYKLFADESRLKILYLLTMNEMCVSDIAATLNMNQSTVSHQLKRCATAASSNIAGMQKLFTIPWMTSISGKFCFRVCFM